MLLSKTLVRSLLIGSALTVLMGANAEDCGGVVSEDDGGVEPNECVAPPAQCPPGTRPSATCDDQGNLINFECVPEVVCPDGTPAVPVNCQPTMDPAQPEVCDWVCEPPNGCPPGTHPELVCDPCDENGMADNCYEQCVPDGMCPPGTHPEQVCEDQPPPSMDPNDPMVPPPQCWDQCVPDDQCPPGSEPQVVCEYDPMTQEERCYTTCTPVEPCPPGTHEELVCREDPNDPMGGECALQCVPDEPNMCPPGTHEETRCDENMQCWTE